MREDKEYKLKFLDSVNQNEDNKESNMLIRGDNMDSLRLLTNEYKNKVDVIYIDPIYNDKQHKWYTNVISKDGKYNKHQSWANFMEARLTIAEELMSDNSVLFISINDEEVFNLKGLCDKVFKKLQFTCNFIWNKGATSSNNNNKNINICTEYILCYSTKDFSFNLNYKDYRKYKCNHGENYAIEEKVDNRASQLISMKSNKQYAVKVELKDKSIITIEGAKAPQETIKRYQKVGKIFVNSNKVAYYKSFAEEEKQGICYHNLLLDAGTSKSGTAELEHLIDKGIAGFYPKPVDLIKQLLLMSVRSNSIVLDFFAGSGTTGQAVLELNNEIEQNVRFILCTNNENNIFDEICLPRIKNLIRNKSNESLSVYEIIEGDICIKK